MFYNFGYLVPETKILIDISWKLIEIWCLILVKKFDVILKLYSYFNLYTTKLWRTWWLKMHKENKKKEAKIFTQIQAMPDKMLHTRMPLVLVNARHHHLSCSISFPSLQLTYLTPFVTIYMPHTLTMCLSPCSLLAPPPNTPTR
jgi:hypothetical protein